MGSACLTSLPLEIVDGIFSCLGERTLLKARLLNHRLEVIATARAFRKIYLHAEVGNYRKPFTSKFTHTAKSTRLRELVRELYCTISISTPTRWRESYIIDLLNALPLLRQFRSLDTLHLSVFRNVKRPAQWVIDFEYRVLDTIFQSLAGIWSPRRQVLIDNALGFRFPAKLDQDEGPSAFLDAGPVRFKRLRVNGCGDYNDPRIVDSGAFKAVLSSDDLIDLCLGTDWASQERFIDEEESLITYGIFGDLPRSWLPMKVSENLRVLMLTFDGSECWRWFPKANFQTIKLPYLRVLGLRNYVFRYQWQVDWVASWERAMLEASKRFT